MNNEPFTGGNKTKKNAGVTTKEGAFSPTAVFLSPGLLTHERDNGRAEPLPVPLLEEVLGRHGQHRVLRLDQLLDGVGEGGQVLAREREGVHVFFSNTCGLDKNGSYTRERASGQRRRVRKNCGFGGCDGWIHLVILEYMYMVSVQGSRRGPRLRGKWRGERNLGFETWQRGGRWGIQAVDGCGGDIMTQCIRENT